MFKMVVMTRSRLALMAVFDSTIQWKPRARRPISNAIKALAIISTQKAFKYRAAADQTQLAVTSTHLRHHPVITAEIARTARSVKLVKFSAKEHMVSFLRFLNFENCELITSKQTTYLRIMCAHGQPRRQLDQASWSS